MLLLTGTSLSSAIPEPVPLQAIEVRNPVNLPDGCLHVVLYSSESNRLPVEQDVARPPIPVARLADGTNVAHRLPTVKAVHLTKILVAVVAEVVGEDTRYVRVPDEAQPLDFSEHLVHLSRAVYFFRKQMVFEWTAG